MAWAGAARPRTADSLFVGGGGKGCQESLCGAERGARGGVAREWSPEGRDVLGRTALPCDARGDRAPLRGRELGQ